MARLLECQKEELLIEPEILRLFAIALLLSLLDVYESDLTANELAEIERFSIDWSKQ